MPAYEEAPEVADIAKRIIAKSHPHKEKVNIGYLFRDRAPVTGNGRVTFGMAMKVDDRNHVFSGRDAIIWVSKDAWDLMSDALKDMLVDHELCHVTFTLNEEGTGIELSETTGRPLVTTLPHDFEDFEAIMDRHPKGRVDMKEVTKQYLKALEAAKSAGKGKTQDAHVTGTPSTP